MAELEASHWKERIGSVESNQGLYIIIMCFEVISQGLAYLCVHNCSFTVNNAESIVSIFIDSLIQCFNEK